MLKLIILISTFIVSISLFAADSCEVEIGLTEESQAEMFGLVRSVQNISEPDRCSLAIQYDPENPQVYETIRAGLETRGYTVTRYNPDESRSNFFNLFPNVRCERRYEKCYIRFSLHFFNDPTALDEIDFPSVMLEYDFEIDPAASDEDHMQEVLESLDKKSRKKFKKCNSLQRTIRSARAAESYFQSYHPELTRQYQQAAIRCRIEKSFRGFDEPVCPQ